MLTTKMPFEEISQIVKDNNSLSESLRDSEPTVTKEVIRFYGQSSLIEVSKDEKEGGYNLAYGEFVDLKLKHVNTYEELLEFLKSI